MALNGATTLNGVPTCQQVVDEIMRQSGGGKTLPDAVRLFMASPEGAQVARNLLAALPGGQLTDLSASVTSPAPKPAAERPTEKPVAPKPAPPPMPPPKLRPVTLPAPLVPATFKNVDNPSKAAWQLVDAGPLNVSIKPGSGAGKAKNFEKLYTNIPKDGAIMSFEIMFAPGFEWACRGKVGGFHIGPGSSSGCRYSRNGASHRLMWEGQGTPFAYVYVPSGSMPQQPAGLNKKVNCGANLFQSDYKGLFKPGKWHTVELGVKLNAPGKPNGQLFFSVDGAGKLVDGVLWRYGNERIENFGWNVFHGGGCSASKASSLQIRNVRMKPW